MARLIVKSPYLKPGGKKSPGGYAKYIATREGVVMAEDTSRHLPATDIQKKQISKLLKEYPDSKNSFEYADYRDNPTRGNADYLLQSIAETYGLPERDVYLRYISERPGVEKMGSHGLFTDEGVPIVLSQVMEEMNTTQSNIWTHIISLRREDAERLGYNNPEVWMHLLRSQRSNIAQQMKIAPENFRWYAAFHNEGHHPHVHMMAYSIKPEEAYLTPKGIENIKSSLAKEIFQQDLLQIYQRQTEIRDDLREQSRKRLYEIVREINQGGFDNPEMQLLFVRLSDRLAKHKGKTSYGYLQAGTKKIVDEIVRGLSSDPRIREMYDLWYEMKEDVLRTYTDTFPDRVPLEQNTEFKPIRNAVIQQALQLEISPMEGGTPMEDHIEYQLGKALCYGEDMPRDLESGMEWLHTAAQHGSEQAEQLHNHIRREISLATIQMGISLLCNLASVIENDAHRQYNAPRVAEGISRRKAAQKRRALGLRRTDEQRQGMTMG